jgi:hypothetical protein
MQQAIIFAVLVGCINVCLNLSVREAARPSPLSIQWFGPDNSLLPFLSLAFLIGCGSLTAMFFFYRLEGNLARGLILMGAVSIVVGSIATMMLSGKLVDRIEILMLATLAVLFVFRWMKTVSWFRTWLSGST